MKANCFSTGNPWAGKKKGPYEYRLCWDDVVYAPGTLKVVTFKGGRKWATAIVKTATTPAQRKLQPDRSTIQADGRDLSFVTANVADPGGLIVPRAGNRTHFEIQGPGEIVGTDNRGPTSFELFQSHDCKCFNGLAVVIVRAKPGQPGTIRLAKGDGRKSGAAAIYTRLERN